MIKTNNRINLKNKSDKEINEIILENLSQDLFEIGMIGHEKNKLKVLKND